MAFIDKLNSAMPGVSGAVGIGTSVANTVGQYMQMNYQKKMQQEAWRREDTAVQRRVADLNAAGLSPTLAAGSSAAASAPITIPAPDHGDIQGNIRGAAEMVGLQKSIAKTEADTQRTNAEIAKVQLESDKLDLENKRTALETDILQRDYDIIKGEKTGKLYKRNSGFLSEFLDVVNTVLDRIGYSGSTKLKSLLSSKSVNSASSLEDDFYKIMVDAGGDKQLSKSFAQYMAPIALKNPDFFDKNYEELVAIWVKSLEGDIFK